MHAAMVEGGVDFNCGSLYKTNLLNTVQDGSARVNETVLDVSVGRVYRTLFEVRAYGVRGVRGVRAVWCS